MILRFRYAFLGVLLHILIIRADITWDPFQLSPYCTVHGKKFAQLYVNWYLAACPLARKSRPPFWAFQAYSKNKHRTFGHVAQRQETFKNSCTGYQRIFTYPIRVLLDQKTGVFDDLHIECKSGFVIRDARQPDISRLFENSSLHIKRTQHGLVCNNQLMKSDFILIEPRSGQLGIDKHIYEGVLYTKIVDDTVEIINELDIEDYVYSVVRFEGWPGWPLEVNKAFAVAIRTYLVSKVIESRKNNKAYHIKNTNIHQTYRGVHDSIHLKQAISDTRGLVITYNNKPIIAMFDSCCGGIIPARMDDLAHDKTPYLKRTYPCHFCKTCKIYTWQREYQMEDVIKALHTPERPIKKIKSLKVVKKDRAGIVKQVQVASDKGTFTLSGRQMYNLFSRIVSFSYGIEKRHKTVSFSGKGYGHHMGLCQWGARRMVDLGYTYQQMLSFYYPDTRLMCLRNI
jgi:stage II sporulation protein D